MTHNDILLLRLREAARLNYNYERSMAVGFLVVATVCLFLMSLAIFTLVVE
jgi:hypothetical protein